MEELIGSPTWRSQAEMGGAARWAAWRGGARRVARQNDPGSRGTAWQHWPGPQVVRNEAVETEKVASATEEAERSGLTPQF